MHGMWEMDFKEKNMYMWTDEHAMETQPQKNKKNTTKQRRSESFASEAS